ncbi:probable long-chain-alcohol O-fatty-acyltransferase 5 [Dendrobium catenatum]|uniref:Putative long-chain-alcohol O-fatty-acyltransferase 4 n=1 Tax=Dendrobium catenatum TaxID=906689 RepID=A0A2I0WRM4_9ASPA|nr:probable long-chain-alcohol O-fatty-acyltransferase 5 [Dendrobium catenatum]PKU78329.1 putative long-chain-alcohol O-fatty-acyltransferase 4 [Dendrobium catenatum]
MSGDMEALLKVSASVAALTAYARFAASKTTPGRRRFFALIPAISPLFFLPLSFTSIHFRSISGFFLGWLAVFKLLLLSFDSGPLFPSLSFLTFLPIAVLPVKLRHISPSPKAKPPHLLPTAIKAILLSLLIPLYSHHDRFPHHLLLSIYCLHIYLGLELVLASAAFLAGILLGLDLEPQFNAPYLSTSLQDFWGRRWNLMVTAILRPSVYGPVRARWGAPAGVVATFLVSGVMHELMFYYITSAPPTGEVSCFFLLHGVCTAVEGWIRKAAKRRAGEGMMVNPVVSAAMTLGFVVLTGFWLFFPPVVRTGSDQRVVEECLAAMRFLEGGGRAILRRLGLQLNLTEAKIL